jgi:hypothetical protein
LCENVPEELCTLMEEEEEEEEDVRFVLDLHDWFGF